MKKTILLFCCSWIMPIQAGNLCLDFPYTGQWLRNAALEKTKCDCTCWQQPKSTMDGKHGYRCLRCGHRLLPEDIFASKKRAPRSKIKSIWTKPRIYKRYHHAYR